MESADLDQVKAVLERQGALLGRHQAQLQTVEDSLGAIATSITDLAAQLQQVQLALVRPPQPQLATPPDPPGPPGNLFREPRLPAPALYAGEPGTCRSFLSQCSLVFQLQPATFPSDQSRVAYVITLLAGRAREWGTAVWDSNSPVCLSYQAFIGEMKKVFDRSVHGREAARVMLQIRQGKRSASDYAIDFRNLATTSGWNPDAQYDAFLYGLSEAIKDEVATRELPSTFDDLVELAIRVDKRLKQRAGEREFRPPPRSPASEAPLPFLPAPAYPSLPEPMQVDRTHLSPAERRRRRDTNSCMYCGKPGHYSAQCPAKGNAHP